MNDSNLVGRCGLYCGACDIYRAERDGREYVEKLAKGIGCGPDRIRCNGCADLGPDCWGTGCQRISCLEDKGLQFCYECPDHEGGKCEKYEELARRYLECGEDIRASLETLRDRGIEEWLAESKARWTCPHCGKPTIVGMKLCHHCREPIQRP